MHSRLVAIPITGRMKLSDDDEDKQEAKNFLDCLYRLPNSQSASNIFRVVLRFVQHNEILFSFALIFRFAISGSFVLL